MHAAASPMWLYFLLVAGIIALPGMDMAFVLASALTGGRRGGLAALGGIVTGGWIHVVAGSLGLGLLLQGAPSLFRALLLAGAGYIAWIGLALLRTSSSALEVATDAPPTARATYGRAMATCLLNPKAYLFTFAVFPQFLRVDGAAMAGQVGALVAITSATQVAIYGGIALAAARARAWLQRTPTAQRGLARGVGLFLLLAAAWTAAQALD